MAEKKPSADELLNQINDFENTIANLQKNIQMLKEKIVRNKSQFGTDVSKWPGM